MPATQREGNAVKFSRRGQRAPRSSSSCTSSHFKRLFWKVDESGPSWPSVYSRWAGDPVPGLDPDAGELCPFCDTSLGRCPGCLSSSMHSSSAPVLSYTLTPGQQPSPGPELSSPVGLLPPNALRGLGKSLLFSLGSVSEPRGDLMSRGRPSFCCSTELQTQAWAVPPPPPPREASRCLGTHWSRATRHLPSPGSESSFLCVREENRTIPPQPCGEGG